MISIPRGKSRKANTIWQTPVKKWLLPFYRWWCVAVHLLSYWLSTQPGTACSGRFRQRFTRYIWRSALGGYHWLNWWTAGLDSGTISGCRANGCWIPQIQGMLRNAAHLADPAGIWHYDPQNLWWALCTLFPSFITNLLQHCMASVIPSIVRLVGDGALWIIRHVSQFIRDPAAPLPSAECRARFALPDVADTDRCRNLNFLPIPAYYDSDECAEFPANGRGGCRYYFYARRPC